MHKTANYHHAQGRELFDELMTKEAGPVSYMAPRAGIGAVLGAGAGAIAGGENNRLGGAIMGAAMGVGAGAGVGYSRYLDNTIKFERGATKFVSKDGYLYAQKPGGKLVRYNPKNEELAKYIKGLRKGRVYKMNLDKSKRVEHGDLLDFFKNNIS